jgi:hypothetical protein
VFGCKLALDSVTVKPLKENPLSDETLVGIILKWSFAIELKTGNLFSFSFQYSRIFDSILIMGSSKYFLISDVFILKVLLKAVITLLWIGIDFWSLLGAGGGVEGNVEFVDGIGLDVNRLGVLLLYLSKISEITLMH